MVRSVLYLHPRRGNHGAVVDFYRRRAVLGRAVALGGCLGSELHVPRGGSGPLLVTALWDGEGSYRRWLENDGRRELAGELAELLDESGPPGVGDLYEVVLDVAPEEGT